MLSVMPTLMTLPYWFDHITKSAVLQQVTLALHFSIIGRFYRNSVSCHCRFFWAGSVVLGTTNPAWKFYWAAAYSQSAAKCTLLEAELTPILVMVHQQSPSYIFLGRFCLVGNCKPSLNFFIELGVHCQSAAIAARCTLPEAELTSNTTRVQQYPLHTSK